MARSKGVLHVCDACGRSEFTPARTISSVKSGGMLDSSGRYMDVIGNYKDPELIKHSVNIFSQEMILCDSCYTAMASLIEDYIANVKISSTASVETITTRTYAMNRGEL